MPNRWDEHDDGMSSVRKVGAAILWSTLALVGVLAVLFFLMARA